MRYLVDGLVGWWLVRGGVSGEGEAPPVARVRFLPFGRIESGTGNGPGRDSAAPFKAARAKVRSVTLCE